MGKEQQVIENRLQRLIKGIKNANWGNCNIEHMAQLAKEQINELQQRGVKCVDRFVQKLLDGVGKKEDYLDILMEGRFAIVLARNNFQDIEIEYSDNGPDLKARWNRKTIYFEATRKRPNEDEEQASHLGGGVYWVKPAGSDNYIGKIQGKLRQLKPGEMNIVVLWSDTPRWSQRGLGEAHK